MADKGRHRSSLKQQNKPFKSRNKSAKERSGRTIPTLSHTADWVASNKTSRKNTASQKRKLQRDLQVQSTRGNLSQSQSSLKLVGLIAMNMESDCEEIKTSFLENLSPGKSAEIFLQVIPRNEISILDWGKIVDCIVTVFSCKNADLSKAKIDPSTCQAIDHMGYTVLSLLKTQGLPPVIGVLQHLETNSIKKQKDVKKLFNRYYESEFPNGAKMCMSTKLYQCLQSIETVLSHTEENNFKACRAYLWGNNVGVNGNCLQVTGYLKGSGLISPNQLVHVTGHGDFAIGSLVTPNGEFFPDNPESLIAENDPGTFAAEQTWPTDQELSEAFSRLEVKTDHVKENFSNDEDEDEEDALEMSDEEKQVFEFEERKKEDLDFPDEVNTPHDQLAKIRFQKYRGLASFRTSEWDPYENLPIPYGKLFEFREPNHVIKKIAADLVKSAAQTSVGMQVTINILNFPIGNLSPDLPVIVSSLLPHERKLSVLNFKLERWGNTEEALKSKEEVTLHYGFRRVVCRPVYSEDTTGDKSKYLREFKDSGYIVASIYAPAAFPPCNVLVFKDMMEGPGLVAVGNLLSFDPKRLIIKRILITGYPLKVFSM